jgi:VIT1/CCC1 family predicted Fe2+/Mn2+ transporter
MKLNYYRHYGDIEQHSRSSSFARDVIMGMADGITVPFAIAAGLAIGAASRHLIITGGFAEIAAGSISMGLGGYLAAKSYVDYYQSEKQREIDEIKNKHDVELKEVEGILETYGVTEPESKKITESISKNKSTWLNFMMRFELGLEKPDRAQAIKSAATIALAYVVGGLIPLSPYIVLENETRAFSFSILVTILALIVFGYVRGKFTTGKPLRSAIETIVIGGVAATAAFLLAKII